MSPLPPPPGPPPGPWHVPQHFSQPVPPPVPGNGPARTSLIIGIVTLCLSVVPGVGAVGAVAAAIGVVLGVIGFRRGRRTAIGTGSAVWGMVLSGIAVVVSVAVTWVSVLAGQAFVRYLGDWFDTATPADPSGSIGEPVDVDGGDLVVTVTEVTCAPTDYTWFSCSFTFDAENTTDAGISLDTFTVKSVVDGAWVDVRLEDGGLLEAGAGGSYQGTVTSEHGALEGLVFDTTDASSHGAAVVDVTEAWDGLDPDAEPAPDPSLTP